MQRDKSKLDFAAKVFVVAMPMKVGEIVANGDAPAALAYLQRMKGFFDCRYRLELRGKPA